MMETRGRSPSQVRLRRRFLRFCRIAAGWRVVEVGSGSGVVARDVAALVGPRGHVTGVDRSRVLLAAARLYQGQTTNFRTPGGGFAPVFFLRPFQLEDSRRCR